MIVFLDRLRRGVRVTCLVNYNNHSLRLSMCRKGKLKEARCELQKLLKDGNNSIEHYTQINTVSKEIETLCDEIIAGSKIRAKVQFLETNEKPTRYFLHREKK